MHGHTREQTNSQTVKSRISYAYKMFTVTHYIKTKGHQWKLYPTHCYTNVRKHFFCERVIAPWNSLKIMPDTVQSIATFKSLVNSSDLSQILHLL